MPSYHINNDRFFLRMKLACWRDECDIPKAKKIQKVIDRLYIRQQAYIKRYGIDRYNGN
jgi:hypothetical protein